MNGVTMSRIGLRFCMQGAYHIRQKYRHWGGGFIAYLSCHHSVSHFVVKCVNYWNQ